MFQITWVATKAPTVHVESSPHCKGRANHFLATIQTFHSKSISAISQFTFRNSFQLHTKWYVHLDDIWIDAHWPLPQVLFLTRNFTDNTLVKKALQSFFGIGPLVAKQILARHFIHPLAKMGSLPNQKVLDLTAELSTMKIENDKRREIVDNITRLRNLGTYRGRRHAMGLPVRGQNTRSGQVRVFNQNLDIIC